MYKKYFIKIISISIIAFIFYILIKTLLLNLDELVRYEVKFIYWKFAVSLVFLLLSYTPIPWMWCIILKGLNVNLSYRKSSEIQYISWLGRYIPGKIWMQIAQAYLAKKEEIPIRVTLISNMILLIVRTLGSIYIFLASFFLWENYNLIFKLLIFLSILIASYVIFKTNILEKVINFILKNIFKKDARIALRYDNIIFLHLIIIGSWVMAGIGYYFMVSSIFTISIKSCITIVGVHAISCLVGYYAIIFPGGLGVTEGVFVFLLSSFFPLSVSIMIGLACRLWYTLGEAIISSIGLVSAKWIKGGLGDIDMSMRS